MIKIIGITGKIGAGKDTVHELLNESLTDIGLKTTKISFAKPLKDATTTMTGWDRERLEHDFDYKEGDTLDDGSPDPICQALGMTRRVFMQKFGTECMRENMHLDFWVILTTLALRNGTYDDYDVGFLTDCRFLNELGFVRANEGSLVQVTRKGDRSTLSEETQHKSELEWEDWDGGWDHYVDNVINPKLSKAENLDNFKTTLEEQVLSDIFPEHFSPIKQFYGT